MDIVKKKIQHAQTVLTVDEIQALKTKTGIPDVKWALAEAVRHYLACEHTK